MAISKIEVELWNENYPDIMIKDVSGNVLKVCIADNFDIIAIIQGLLVILNKSNQEALDAMRNRGNLQD